MKLLKPMWVSKEGTPIFSIDIHPDGSRFATGGQGHDSGRVVIWNMKCILRAANGDTDGNIPKYLSIMDHHLACVNCVRWSNSGKYLASGGDDKIVMIWEKGISGSPNTESWRCKTSLRRHDGDILDLAWNAADSLLATASVDNSVIVWNGLKFPDVIAVLKGHSGLVKGVIFDPVGTYLASQSDDKTLRLWRTSDWKEESVISEPFDDCGATTHFLRPGWSPDGSFIVSAHAMNCGGPTAQIIDRRGWKKNRDFVGHKKAISCVRFNNHLFQRDGTSEVYVTVALGSRDRGFSVWSTHLKRPYFVVNDVFDQSVLDLSWQRNILMACSMDGSVAVVILDDSELGSVLSESKTYEFMSSTYGSTYGQKPKPLTNGKLIAENPEVLTLCSKVSGEENNENEKDDEDEDFEKERRSLIRGPTDKQIEALTSDGKRRITPIFILPETSLPLGSGEFGSSSTKEKSKIAVEKVQLITPGLSPKTSCESSSNNSKDSSGLLHASSKGKTSKSKACPNHLDSVVVNVIQVKKKSKVNGDSSGSLKSNGVLVSSSIPQRKESTTPQISFTEDVKSKEKILKKPELIKRKISLVDSQDNENSFPRKKRLRSISEQKTSDEPQYILPPLTLKSSSLLTSSGHRMTLTVLSDDLTKLTVAVSVSLRTSSQEKKEFIWETLFNDSIVSLCSSESLLLVCTSEGSLHFFDALKGSLLLPPLILPNKISAMSIKDSKLAIVTTSAEFYLWDIKDQLPKILLRREALSSFLSSNSTIRKLHFIDSQPLIITSTNKSYVYNEALGTWLKITDGSNLIKFLSAYNSSISSSSSLPLSSLDTYTYSLPPPSSSSSSSLLDSSIAHLASLTHCENQKIASEYLSSPNEYKYWLFAQIRHLTENENDYKLRLVLDDLIGPLYISSSSSSSNWKTSVLGLDKRSLLKDSLKLIGSSGKHQGLFAEYSELLNSSKDLNDAAASFLDL